MVTYNLPGLRSDGALPPAQAYGGWQEVANLNALAEALDVDSGHADLSQLKSIPDAWAQAHVFQQALFDPAHALHADAVAQWRGLLALLALQPEYRTVYDLDVVSVDLRQADSSKRLSSVLRHLLPTASLDAGRLDWRDVGCLVFREKSGGTGAFARALKAVPVGLMSPAALIVAGRDAHHLRSAGVPWMTSGLTDPLAVPGIPPRQYQILAEYLNDLAIVASQLGDPNGERPFLTRLLQRLEEFHGACLERVQTLSPLKEAQSSVRWPNPNYAMLGRTKVFNLDGLAAGHSECKIALRKEAEAVFDGAILIDPTLTETFGRSAEAITVWEQFSLRDAANPTTLQRIREDAAAKRYLVLTPEDFFTHELVCFTAGAEVEAHGRQGFEGALMPFSPLVILLLTPSSLATAASMDLVGDEHRVRLNLALPTGRQHGVCKTFGPGRGQTAEVQPDEDRPDDLSVWPNVTSKSWRWNYLHYQYNPKYELKPRFGISADFLAHDLVHGTLSTTDKTRRLAEWNDPVGLHPDRRLFSAQTSEISDDDGNLLLQRLRFSDTENVIGEFQRLPRGVEAIYFARRRDGEGTERPVGLALVRTKTAVAAPGDAVVAIDFGTTNTVAYQTLGAQSSPMTFEDRLVFPIRHTQKEAEQRERLVEAYTEFFPLRRHETPFPTVAKRRELFAGGGGMDEDLWAKLKAGHPSHGFSDAIFFVPQFDRVGVAQTQGFLNWTANGILVFGIKWDPDEAIRRLTTRFLRQVMMMCAAELMEKGVDAQTIRWRFSYPQAFGRQDRDDFQNLVIDAWNDLFGGGRIKGGELIKFETEGAAAAHYFMFGRRGGQTTAGKLMLMFDIGGGTTDIALWFDEQLKWRNSFRLAGGDFFTRFLANNIAVLEKIGFGDVATSLANFAGGEVEPDARLNFVELFVNAPSFSRNFESNFSAFSMEPEGAGLRHCASVAVGGIFYYVGQALRALVKDGVLTDADLSNVTLAFAGRGSALLRYFNRGEAGDTPLHHLGRMIAAGADIPVGGMRIDTLFTDMPKHEVALGLLTPLTEAQEKSQESRLSPLGEAIDVTIGGQKARLEAGRDVRDLIGASDLQDLGLSQFTGFLAALKAHTGLDVDLSAQNADAARRIQQAAGGELRRALRQIARDQVRPEDVLDTQLAEPPFISELKALVNLMNLPVVDRKKRLAVTERLR